MITRFKAWLERQKADHVRACVKFPGFMMGMILINPLIDKTKSTGQSDDLLLTAGEDSH